MTSTFLLSVILVATVTAVELAHRHAALTAQHTRFAVPPTSAPAPRIPGPANCTERFFTQQVDHFSWVSPPTGVSTYQRACVRACSACVR